MNKVAFCVLSSMFALLLLGQVAFSESNAKAGQTPKLEKAMFAEGCFWKTQYVFSKVPGVVKTQVGYSGGTVDSPTYPLVCTDKTGHAETTLVEYDPTKTNYHKLLEVFFDSHDPTTVNRQGPDVGTQYRSAIFYLSPAQKQEASEYIQELQRLHRVHGQIVTEVKPAGKFYPAEEYHQNYYVKHGAVCQ